MSLRTNTKAIVALTGLEVRIIELVAHGYIVEDACGRRYSVGEYVLIAVD